MKGKIQLWPADTTSFTEKAAWTAMYVLPTLLYLFMVLSALGLFSNQYQQSVAQASPAWHITGFVLTVVTGAWIWAVATDSNRVTKSEWINVVILFVLAAASLLAYSGFTWYFNAL